MVAIDIKSGMAMDLKEGDDLQGKGQDMRRMFRREISRLFSKPGGIRCYLLPILMHFPESYIKTASGNNKARIT